MGAAGWRIRFDVPELRGPISPGGRVVSPAGARNSIASSSPGELNCDHFKQQIHTFAVIYLQVAKKFMDLDGAE